MLEAEKKTENDLEEFYGLDVNSIVVYRDSIENFSNREFYRLTDLLRVQREETCVHGYNNSHTR